MSKMDTSRITQLDIKDIDYSSDKIVARFETETPESEELEELYNSVKKHRILEPILVRPKGANRYEVVAGNRRLTVAKRAKLDIIPAIITDVDDIHASRIACVENVHRKNLPLMQKAKLIVKLYKAVGIPKEIAIIKVKHLYNSKQKNTDGANVSKYGNKEIEENSRPTPAFLDVFEDIGLSANTQYQLLQLVTVLPLTVQEKIQKEKIAKEKAILLTHTKLREHPELQSILTDQIKNLTNSQATTKVRQTIHDLETGAIRKDKVCGYVINDYDREKITEKPEIEAASFNSYVLDYTSVLNKTIGKILDTRIAKGDIFYDKKAVTEKLEALEKNLKTTRKEYRERFAIAASTMMKICKVIVDMV